MLEHGWGSSHRWPSLALDYYDVEISRAPTSIICSGRFTQQLFAPEARPAKRLKKCPADNYVSLSEHVNLKWSSWQLPKCLLEVFWFHCMNLSEITVGWTIINFPWSTCLSTNSRHADLFFSRFISPQSSAIVSKDLAKAS
jgi:hypothetical protein